MKWPLVPVSSAVIDVDAAPSSPTHHTSYINDMDAGMWMSSQQYMTKILRKLRLTRDSNSPSTTIIREALAPGNRRACFNWNLGKNFLESFPINIYQILTTTQHLGCYPQHAQILRPCCRLPQQWPPRHTESGRIVENSILSQNNLCYNTWNCGS